MSRRILLVFVVRFNIFIFVTRRRSSDYGEVDLIIADDGLQHHAMARDVDIAVVDAR
ncbi:MAG: tetraacyldisaccharide 4'-kinase, partial [Bacteroidota bacterium]